MLFGSLKGWNFKSVLASYCTACAQSLTCLAIPLKTSVTYSKMAMAWVQMPEMTAFSGSWIKLLYILVTGLWRLPQLTPARRRIHSWQVARSSKGQRIHTHGQFSKLTPIYLDCERTPPPYSSYLSLSIFCLWTAYLITRALIFVKTPCIIDT